MTELDNIISLTQDILGTPRRENDVDSWWEFCCPNCASIAGVESDGKYNLCVSFKNAAYHCWKCQDKGRLSKLIRVYGGSDKLRIYNEELRNIRNARLFTLDENSDIYADIAKDCDCCVELPDGYTKITGYKSKAFDYLLKRGLDLKTIQRFNIGFVAWKDDNFLERNRVVIPSYDINGELNYWVARDYTNHPNRMKYCNPKIKKTEIVFNELLVNWYEDITLVEGVFDHMVVPNSIPLLGKKIDADNAVYKRLMESAMANVNILLDSDAEKDALKIYKFLNDGILRGRVRFITCPQGEDPSSVYQKYGARGVINMMNHAKKIDEFDLLYC